MLSLPIEFENRMKQLLGEEWNDFLTCYENDKYQGLRINRLKVSEASPVLAKATGHGDGPSVPWTVDGYYYDETVRPGKHPYHEMGLYYIQEPSAMSAAALLAPEPGMRVLDMCAAPGGKTTQLASFLNQLGLLVANEINRDRAKILSSNVERMGIANCIVTNEDTNRLREHFGCYFHAILVDAPCSGEGMFRKLPIAIDEWSPDNVIHCSQMQAEILDNAAELLLPGGRLVYSTCTFAPQENEGSIAAFLMRHPEFHVVETDAPFFSPAIPEWIPFECSQEIQDQVAKTFRLWPHKLHGEGHYAAVLEKDGILPPYSAVDLMSDSFSNKGKKKKSGKDLPNGKGKPKGNQKGQQLTPDESLKEFCENTLRPALGATLTMSGSAAFGDQLYRLPVNCPPLNGLHIMRSGLHLGEFKKNRFEPSHSLALFLKPDDVLHAISLRAEDERTVKYFNGETFALCDEDFMDGKMPKGGWCLLCVDGYSAGWGKVANGTLKNHYPKGLRRMTETAAEIEE